MDRTFYFIECSFRSGNAFVEVERSRMSRKEVIADIASGQYEDVVSVIECNPVEHTCDDVTEEFLREANALREPEPRRRATQEQIWDHERDARKHERVA